MARTRISVFASFWLALSCSVWAAPTPGLAPYLDGLDALEAGRAEEALEAFSQAVEADDENPDYFAARGTARVLAEAPPAAIKDLERSLRLRPEHRETKMWLACAVAMTGDFGRDTFYFPAATRDPYESYAREGSREYGELAFRQTLGEMHEQAEPLRQSGRRKLRESVAAFARRIKERPELAEALAARGRARAEGGRPADALPDLDRVLAARPEDPDALLLHARGLLELGAPAPAQAELTRALTFRTDLGPAYAARALAAARLGDARRARSDLEIASRLAPAAAAESRDAVEHELAASVAAGSNESLLAALQAASSPGAGFEPLVLQALGLQRAVYGRSLRHDEWYQDRLRELEAAAGHAPPDPASITALGRFLLDQRSVRRERVEPRAPWRPYRWQTAEGQARELDRAEQLAEQALALAPDLVPALALKASARMSRGRYGDAETLLRRALELAPGDPEVLGLFAQVLEVAAAQKSAEAANLRTPRYLGSHEETVGDWVYTYTRWLNPSQADLAQADALGQQAQQMEKWALEQIRAAAGAARGTAPGFYYQGVYHWKLGEIEASLAAYDQAVRLDPGQVSWHFNRAALLTSLGRTAEALEARVQGTLLVQTTAAPLLELVWEHVARTRWRSAAEALNRAAAQDPADARVSAYQGVVAQAAEKPEEAIAAQTAALALEEARLRRGGRSLGAGASGPLTPEDYGLSLALRRRLGRLLLDAGRPQDALAVFEPGVRLEPRIPRDSYATDVPSAQLPDPDLDPTVVPEADHALALLAWMRVGTGAALQALGRNDEALATLEPVAGLENLLINGYGAQKLRRPTLEAALHMARAALAKDDLEAAERHASMLPRKRHGMGPSLNPHADLEDVGSQLQEEVARRKQAQRERGDERSEEWTPADEQKVAAALRRIGTVIGHPEMGDGTRRYAGEAREVELCILVDQVVRFIVEPKSTRWRAQIVQGLQMLEAARIEQEALAAQLRDQDEGMSGRRADPRFQRGSGDPMQDAQARVGRFEAAAEALRNLAVEAGYPAAELQAATQPSGGASGPEGSAGDGAEEPPAWEPPAREPPVREPGENPAEAAFARIAGQLGLPDTQRMGRVGASFENLLSMGVRQAVEALFEPRPEEQRHQFLDSALQPLVQLRERNTRQAERLRRQIEQARQMEQRRGSRRASSEPLEQRLAEAGKAEQAVNAALALLRELALAQGVSAQEFDAAAGIP